MENKFERELTKDVLVSNEHNRENINAKMNYDLSLLTKEVFEELEYEAAALKIPFLIDREQAFGNLIYGDIDVLRKSIIILIKAVLQLVSRGEAVHIASKENYISIRLPRKKAISSLLLRPEIVISNVQELADFRKALNCIRALKGAVKMNDGKDEIRIMLPIY